MRFAISIPQTVAGGSFDPTGMDTYLAKAEELGFDSAWTGEQVLGTQPLLGRPGTAGQPSTPTDLHDHVTPWLFATGLQLQTTLRRAGGPVVQRRIQDAVDPGRASRSPDGACPTRNRP